VRTFSANNVSDDGVVTPLAVMSSGGWQQVDVKNPVRVWTISTAQLLMQNSSATVEDNEDWVISKGFDPRQIAPDAGTALKNISTVLSGHSYVYTKPGTYKVVFEASAVRYNGEKRLTREITLTITP
jgi:surface-anchored protein